MDTSKILEVFRIIFPVFATMSLGVVLRRRNLMNDNQQKFLTDLAFYFALPALIFSKLSVQPFFLLLNPVLIWGTILPMGLILVLYAFAALVLRMRSTVAAPFITGTFWANVGYMGFPLVAMAFGDEQGLAMAAIINSISMPLFIIIAFVIMGVSSRSKELRLLQSVKSAIINPIIIASALGLLTSFILSFFNLNTRADALPQPIIIIATSAYSFLQMIASMGLPLALIAVGGSLNLKSAAHHIPLLLLTVLGKLLLLPLLTYFLITVFFENVQQEVLGVAVLLMATPVAVASTVVSARYETDTAFVYSLVAISTIVSSITIPFWLYILLS